MEPVIAWATFLVVLIAAGRVGLLFPRIGLPLITGFLFTGVIAGPYILGILTKAYIKPLGLTNQAALAYIAFSAGAELYLPELRSAFKAILYQTAGITVSVMLFITILIAGLSKVSLTPWPLQVEGCSVSVALVAAAICVTSSPAASIAILKELKAKGIFCSTLLGITVLCDVVVLLMFSFTTTIAETECKGDGFSITALAIMISVVLASIALGWVFGKVLIFLVMFKRLPTRWLILPLGLAIFWCCHWFTEWTHENLEYVINFEPLLMCITAGFVCTNQSKHRGRFIAVLQQSGPLIFLPFFTLTGASLDLAVLGQSLIFAFIVSAVRAAALFAGAGAGGALAKQPVRHNLLMWMSQITQAGVSLGLASEVGMAFPTFGRAFQTSIIAVVLVNQVLGPIFFKIAVRSAGEAGKGAGDDEHDEDRIVPTALVVGYTPQTMGIAMKLLNEKWNVVMVAGNDAEAEVAVKDIKEYGVASRAAAAATETGMARAQKAISEQVKEISTGIKQMTEQVEDAAVKAVAGADQIAAGHAAHHDPHHKVFIVEDGFRAVGLLQGTAALDYEDIKPVVGREEGAGNDEEGGNTDHVSLAAAGAEWSVDAATLTTADPTTTAAASAGGASAVGASAGGASAAGAPAPVRAPGQPPKKPTDAPSISPATDYRLSKLVQQVGSIASLAAVVIDFPSDSASFAAVEAVHDRIAAAPRRSHLHGVRVVALVRAPEWVEPFYRMGAVPIHAGAALVTALAKVSTAPLARPIPILAPAYNLDELGKAAQKMTEGPHAWKYLPSGFGAEDNAFVTMTEHKDGAFASQAGATPGGQSLLSVPSFRKRQGGAGLGLPPSTEALSRAMSMRRSPSMRTVRSRTSAMQGSQHGSESADARARTASGNKAADAGAVAISIADPSSSSSSSSQSASASDPGAHAQAASSAAASPTPPSQGSGLHKQSSFSSAASGSQGGVRAAVAAVSHTMTEMKDMVKDEVEKLAGEEVPEWQKQQYLATVEETSGLGMTQAKVERRGSTQGKGLSGILNTLVSGGAASRMTDFTGAGGFGMFGVSADAEASEEGGTAKENKAAAQVARGYGQDEDEGTGVPTGMDAVTYFSQVMSSGNKRLQRIEEVEYLGEFASPFDQAPEAIPAEGGLAGQDANASGQQQATPWG